MHKFRSLSTPVLLLLLLGLPLQGGAAGAEPTPDRDLRPTMQAIFHALTIAFPLSLNAQQFQDRAHRQTIQEALQQLAAHAGQLVAHSQPVPSHFDFLRQSLQRNVLYTLQSFQDGEYNEARRTLHQLTDHCFLCHSRQPSSRHFPLGKRFLDAVSSADLPAQDRVRLAVAARQFDTALTTCETLFQSLEIPAAQLDLMALFEDYLRIAIRVRSDFARAIKTFEAFQQRPDVPRYLTEYLHSWVSSLKTLQGQKPQGDTLLHARRLIRAGQQQNRYLADRQGLVYFVVASSFLHPYVNTTATSALQLAEAYYLLGVADSYIPRSSWISETEFFLEMAIRVAPVSSHAKSAYAFLEEYVITGSTGSAGLHLPLQVQEHLDALRRLVEGS